MQEFVWYKKGCPNLEKLKQLERCDMKSENSA